jgi:Mrr N-terminal domain
MPVVRISEKTWQRLKAHAIPLEDKPDDVINRILDELEKVRPLRPAPVPDSGGAGEAPKDQPKRQPRGQKLRREQFRWPLIETLYELGGRASSGKVRPKMERKMASRLREPDHAAVGSGGEPRWWNDVCWMRNDLREEGLLRGDSPRGIWELSERGLAEVKKLRPDFVVPELDLESV